MPKFKDLFNEDTDEQIKNMGNTLGNLISSYNEFKTVLGKAILKNGNKLKNFASRLEAFMSQYEALMEKYPELKDTENLFKEHPEYKELEIAELFKVLDKKDLTTLKSIIPNNYIIPNNKLANNLTKDFLGMGELALTVIKGKNEVFTTVTMNYDDEGIKIYAKNGFSPYDRCILNSICTLYEAGNKEFIPSMVYRCMNNLTNTEYISPQAVGAVTKSIDKMSTMVCKIDWTNEAKKRGINIDNGLLHGSLIAIKKLTVTTGGKTVEAYTLLDKPILYGYAQATKQVITVPIKLLQTKEAIRSTENVIVIREYLLRRIEVMKRSSEHKSSNQINKIKYGSVYDDLGLINPTKQKSEKVRDAVKKLLSYWREEKYIINFTEYKEGKTIKGIDIFY